MEPTLDSTLQHVLEPALHDAGLGVVPEASALVTPAEQLEQLQQPPMSVPTTPEPVARLKRSVDPVRREANRRAAERSRGRQQEKVVALEMAVQTLSDENLRLKEEIARLEGRDPASDALVNIEQPIATPAEPTPTFDAAAAAAVATQAQQNQHFLELLAQGANFEDTLANLNSGEGGDNPWAQLFSGSEVEVDGRLGQLAAVASNQAGEEPPQAAPVTGDPASPLKAVRPSPISSAALTAEIEKSLQDDIANTKNAIARADRELARRRGQPVYGDVQEEPYEPTYAELVSADDAAIAAQSDKAEQDRIQLDIETNVLREVVARMRDSMEEEEAKLQPLEVELRMLCVDSDREGVTSVLRALRGHITSLMSAPGGFMPGSLLVTPFSSPATARRRRGRPPKHASTASSSKYTFPYQQSPSSSESGTEGPETPSARPPRASAQRRSRLAQELRFEPEQQHSTDAGASHTLPSAVEANVVAETSQATQDYLLSHFAGDGSRDTPIPLDSSSFAAFLPQSPPAHAHHTLDASLSGPAAHITDDASNSLPETPNVMSRFKRGPPGSCDICSRTQTSVWRKLTYEGEELRVCNACGLYHSKFHIPRPPELWGDGRTIKKRKAGPRNWDSVKRRREQQRKEGKFGDDEGVDGVMSGGMDGGMDHSGMDVSINASMDVDHGLEDSSAIAAAGTITPDPAQTTLQEVGRAVENMYAVQQQQQLEG